MYNLLGEHGSERARDNVTKLGIQAVWSRVFAETYHAKVEVTHAGQLEKSSKGIFAEFCQRDFVSAIREPVPHQLE